jgi:aryl-alcohol dehydrogenase-like predicted oxidoreductase
MEYVKLGRTGLDVSRICLGCMSYGGGNRESSSVTEGRSLLARPGLCATTF